MSENENTTNGIDGTQKGFFAKLKNGDFGLAKTYWLYGVLVGVILNIVTRPITSTGLLVIVVLIHTAYRILVIMGIWRAANKYKGSKIWAILAKIATVFGTIILVVELIVIAKLLG